MKGKRSGAWRFALLLVLMLLLLWAGTGHAALEDTNMWLRGTDATWQTLGVKKGTKLPVYSAPFEEAWRGAKGKAAVSVSESFSLIGSMQEGSWLMVSYRVDKKSGRIGWIRNPGQEYLADELFIVREKSRVTRSCDLTDDPLGGQRVIRTLSSGEQVIAMCLVTDTDWVYVETEAEGQVCWGFMNVNALEQLPVFHVEQNTLIVEEGVTRIGWQFSDNRKSIPLNPGDIWCDPLWLNEEGEEIRGLHFPGTLRQLCGESICQGHLIELTFSGRLTDVDDDILYGTEVDTVTLQADYASGVPGGSYAVIREWKVAQGNKKYISRDGVLFSADGKTLLNYPNGRQDRHYDVPPGTEVIAYGAFSDSLMNLPLQTISLPIGLKRIEAFAFSGCGRLLSLTVPLTVTQLEEDAFAHCVSLERLSLPPGLSAAFSSDWARQGDFTLYNGDNGSTYTHPVVEEWQTPEETRVHDVSYLAWISGENGTGNVPVYAMPEADQPAEEWRSGRRVYIRRAENGRGLADYTEKRENWVPLECTIPIAENAFFTVSEIRPTAEGWQSLGLSAEPTVTYSWFDEEDLAAYFFTAEVLLREETDGADMEFTLPLHQVTLYREANGDSRELAYLISQQAEDPIYLLDEPDGIPLTWTYRCDQAEVLARQDHWVKVKTARAAGWVPETKVYTVPQEIQQ